MKPVVIIRLLALALSAAALATLCTGLASVWVDLGALTQFAVTFVFVTLALLVEWRELEEDHEHARDVLAEPARDGSRPAPPVNRSAPGVDGAANAAAAAGSERETGTVKWFNRTKGFGFIVRADGEEVFVHYRNMVGSGRRHLEDGQRVEFVVVVTERGPQADHVRPIDSEHRT